MITDTLRRDDMTPNASELAARDNLPSIVVSRLDRVARQLHPRGMTLASEDAAALRSWRGLEPHENNWFMWRGAQVVLTGARVWRLI